MNSEKEAYEMIVVTPIDVPSDVYLYFLKEAESHPNTTAEDLMTRYLTRYVRQKKYREAKKQNQEKK